jgi:hypothetical protein
MVTLLPNGKVLIAGGADTNTTWTNSTDLYDPAGNTIAPGPAMNTAREGATSTLLPDGKVFIAGGRNANFLNSTELYDPVSNTFLSPDPATLTVAREDAAAVLLPNGKVLIAGGLGAGATVLGSTELYDPASNTFLIPDSAAMNVPRYFETATLLPDGKVLLAGGYGTDGADPLASTELYDPASNSFASATATMNAARALASAGLLPNGKVIIAGGVSGTGATVVNTTDLYSP